MNSLKAQVLLFDLSRLYKITPLLIYIDIDLPNNHGESRGPTISSDSNISPVGQQQARTIRIFI